MMNVPPLQSLHTNNSVITDTETNMSSVPFFINSDTMPTVVSFSLIESPGKLLSAVADKNSITKENIHVNDELAVADNTPAVRKPMITNDDMAL